MGSIILGIGPIEAPGIKYVLPTLDEAERACNFILKTVKEDTAVAGRTGDREAQSNLTNLVGEFRDMAVRRLEPYYRSRLE